MDVDDGGEEVEVIEVRQGDVSYYPWRPSLMLHDPCVVGQLESEDRPSSPPTPSGPNKASDHIHIRNAPILMIMRRLSFGAPRPVPPGCGRRPRAEGGIEGGGEKHGL
jgi:hypothetical protein